MVIWQDLEPGEEVADWLEPLIAALRTHWQLVGLIGLAVAAAILIGLVSR